MDHAVDQALTIIKHRSVSTCSDPTARNFIREKGFGSGWDRSFLRRHGQVIRKVSGRRVCEGGNTVSYRHGNTLMGLARRPSVRKTIIRLLCRPQPRQFCVIDPESNKPVDYDTWGRVELTTRTKDFLCLFLGGMRLLRRNPWSSPVGWRGRVRPFAPWKNIMKEFINTVNTTHTMLAPWTGVPAAVEVRITATAR